MLLERLSELREKNSLSQEQVAQIIGVARNTYSSYENGKREMDYDNLIKLANYYKVSLDYLFGRSNVPLHQESYTEDEIEYMNRSLELYIEMKRKLP